MLERYVEIFWEDKYFKALSPWQERFESIPYSVVCGGVVGLCTSGLLATSTSGK